MAEYALPCIICRTPLKNVFDDCANQPSQGLAFKSKGHYGSTAFDPMDGTHLEINLCDICLDTAAEEDFVYVGRDRRPVVTEDNENIGWIDVHNEPVHWRLRLAGFDDDLVVVGLDHFEELYEERDRYGEPRVKWILPVEDIRNYIKKYEET